MPFRPGPRKAEKDQEGNPSYPCLWVGCDKAFGTAGHVRRHEKTHVGATPYPCSFCDKSFGRSDVRAKHIATMHGSEPEVRSSGSETPPAKLRRLDPNPQHRFDHQRSPSTSRTPHSASSGHSDHHISNSVSMSLPWQQDRRLSNFPTSSNPNPGPSIYMPTTASDSAPDLLNHQNGLMLPPTTSNFSLGGSPSGFLDPAALATGPSSLPMDPALLGVSTSANDLLDPFNTNWELFGQVFGWGLDTDIDLDLGITNTLFDNNNIGPVASTENLSAAWLLAATPRHGSPADGIGAPEQTRDPFGRSHDNPWPNVFKPKVPDRPLTLGGVKASPRPNREQSGKPDAVSQTSRNAMLSLIYLSHQPLWQMPDIDDFPDQDTLSDFVDLYFERFHPTFPILHKASLFSDDTPAILLLAVAAIGGTYSDREFQPLAVAFDELVRRIITWMRASDQRAKFDRPSLRAYTLCTILGVACGSREMFLHAEISRGSLVTMRRRLHLLRPGRTALDDLLARDPKPSVEARWEAYIEDEGKRRFGWGIYLMDLYISALLGIPVMSSVSEISVPFPGDDEPWEAPDAESWAAAMAKRPSTTKPAFHTAIARALNDPSSMLPLDDFSSSILAFTLYNFCHEDYLLRRSLTTDDQGDSTGEATFLTVQDSKSRAALLSLSQSCLSYDTPSHLRLSSAALFHHASMHFTRPGLLEHVRAASGKYEPDMTKETSVEWLRHWVKNGKEVRKVMWHAGVLNALLGEFSRGEFAEFYWTFDCALLLWAVVKFGLESLNTKGLRSALFAANWFDTEPPAIWVEHGGQMVMPFLGSSSSLTVVDTLKLFMDRLSMSPWGLAGQFKQVLVKLLEAER